MSLVTKPESPEQTIARLQKELKEEKKRCTELLKERDTYGAQWAYWQKKYTQLHSFKRYFFNAKKGRKHVAL